MKKTKIEEENIRKLRKRIKMTYREEKESEDKKREKKKEEMKDNGREVK